MRSPNIRYIPAVDHLRAFAALLIVLYHGLHVFSYQARFGKDFGPDNWLQPSNPLLAILAEGHTAVALFMVLSGFILTLGALDGGVDWRGFIRNRLLRTYPLFLLLVFAGACGSAQPFDWSGFVQTIVGFANLPGALVAPPFTSMLWTIAVEWQFYVLFALLVAVLKPDWTRRVLGFVAVLLLVRLAMALNGGNPRDLAYMTIVGRLDQFLLGMWAAWFFRAHPLSRRAGGVLAVLAAAAVAGALVAFNAVGGWPVVADWKLAWPTLEGVLWTGFVLGYVTCADAWNGVVPRLLARIGEISYSIYLIHFVVIWTLVRHGVAPAFTGRVLADALLLTLLVALPLTLAVSTLTYRCIELPFLRLRGRYHRDAASAPTDAAR